MPNTPGWGAHYARSPTTRLPVATPGTEAGRRASRRGRRCGIPASFAYGCWPCGHHRISGRRVPHDPAVVRGARPGSVVGLHRTPGLGGVQFHEAERGRHPKPPTSSGPHCPHSAMETTSPAGFPWTLFGTTMSLFGTIVLTISLSYSSPYWLPRSSGEQRPRRSKPWAATPSASFVVPKGPNASGPSLDSTIDEFAEARTTFSRSRPLPRTPSETLSGYAARLGIGTGLGSDFAVERSGQFPSRAMWRSASSYPCTPAPTMLALATAET